MAHDTSFRDIQVTSENIEVRRIGVKDLVDALKAGYADYSAHPTFVTFLVIVYPLFALLLTLSLLGGNLLYLAFPIVAGLTLIGPVVSVALCEMSRHREAGEDVSLRRSFEFIHTSSFAPIVALSILMMLLYVGWLYMAESIYFGRFGVNPPTTAAEFWTELVTTERGAALMLHGNLVGLIFAFSALAISVVSFPLLLDKPTTSITAIGVSIRAVTTNLWVMLLWGLIVVVLLAAGAVLFLLGLAAVLPILGHATWHLYRKVVAA